MATAEQDRESGTTVELTNHRVVRDGSVWTCIAGCGRTWPWPAPLPEPAGECVPRRWGDQP